jgi:hypothetical protein
MTRFRVVQPWGPDKGRQASVQSEHATAAEAFAALDATSAAMARTGAPADAIELIVVDEHGRQLAGLMRVAAVQTLDLVTKFEAHRHGRHPGVRLGQRRSRCVELTGR